MKKLSVVHILLLGLLGALVIGLSNQHSRWLMINGYAAAKHAQIQIKGEKNTSNGAEFNMVISYRPHEESVSFTEYNSLYVYLYSPTQTPHSLNISWQHLIGSWYVGKLET